MTVPEGFRPIASCPRWFINEYGDIWTDKFKKMMTPSDNGTGYLQVVYRNKGSRKKHYIHRLVAETFIGPIALNMTVNHEDGDKRNNHYTNLTIVTSKANNDHAVETGLRTKWRGSVHPQAKLTEECVREIRERRFSGEKRATIAHDFNITPATVSDIATGKSWSWLN